MWGTQRAQLRRASASDSAASLRLPAEAPQAEDPRAREEEKCGSEAMLSGGAVRPIIATGAGAPPGGCSSDGVEVRLWLEEAEEAGAWYDATSGSDSDPPTPPPQLGSTGLSRGVLLFSTDLGRHALTCSCAGAAPVFSLWWSWAAEKGCCLMGAEGPGIRVVGWESADIDLVGPAPTGGRKCPSLITHESWQCFMKRASG